LGISHEDIKYLYNVDSSKKYSVVPFHCCVSMATLVTRTRRYVTLYVQYLSCLFYNQTRFGFQISLLN